MADRKIRFNGQELPTSAYWLELATYIIPEISAEAREWALDLHYCLGRKRTVSSALVKKCCAEIGSQLTAKRQAVLAELSKRMPEASPVEVFEEWLSSLRMMEEIARQREVCEWELPVTNEEMVRAGTVLSNFYHFLAGDDDERIVTMLDDLSPEQRLEMLHKGLDAISTRSEKPRAPKKPE